MSIYVFIYLSIIYHLAALDSSNSSQLAIYFYFLDIWISKVLESNVMFFSISTSKCVCAIFHFSIHLPAGSAPASLVSRAWPTYYGLSMTMTMDPPEPHIVEKQCFGTSLPFRTFFWFWLSLTLTLTNCNCNCLFFDPLFSILWLPLLTFFSAFHLPPILSEVWLRNF